MEHSSSTYSSAYSYAYSSFAFWTHFWITAIALLALLAQFALLVIYLKSIKKQLSQMNSLPLRDLLQTPFLDLTERVTRTQSELKHSISEGLNKYFLDTQERTERSLTQNRQELHSGLMKTTQALETKFQSLEQQVGLRLETIGKSVEDKLNENLKEGFKHFEKVQHHLQAAELKLASLNVVGQSISDLNSLLKLPHLRGGFGEASLERILADFLPTGSYEMQYAVTPGSTERVDAIVRLATQILPIDSKFPREKVLPLFDSQDPESLEQARKALSEYIKVQAKSISSKYIRPEFGTTDMALLFLPSETLYFEVTRNGDLFESIVKLKVFPTSPNTLAITLRSIALAQEYYNLAKGVEKTIDEVRKAQRHFDHFEKRFGDLGRGLKKAQEAFETANTHLNRYGSSVLRLTQEREAPEGLATADTKSPLIPKTEEPGFESHSANLL